MNLKNKIKVAKTKISENRTEIIAIVFAGMTLVVSTALINKKISVDEDTLYITDETKLRVIAEDKGIWFDVDGNRFDLILHDSEE